VIPDISAALVAHDVSVALDGRSILDRVNVNAGFGKLQVIAGPNGSGKTTLLRALLGLLAPSHGSIHCQGKRVREMSRVERARSIAYVPQRSELRAALSVEEVVSQGRYATALTSTRNDAVWKALDCVGLAELAHRNYLKLSGGERRLALIARAICTGAKIICLDEPVSSLDIANRLRTMSLLRSLAARGHAVVCVLHDLEDIHRFADHVVVLHRGRVAASGKPDDVIGEPLARAVYDVELRRNDALGFYLRDGMPV
jgi:iron complex transport system ATP-binding protein